MFLKTVLGNSILGDIKVKLRLSPLWSWVAIAFNTVDETRLNQVGPDRLCAEWMMKNGGAVYFKETPTVRREDYNGLPEDDVPVTLKEIDATKASIMTIGFEHLKGCKHIDKLILHKCNNLENDGLRKLEYINDSLKHLQLSSCYNINDKGLLELKVLTNLQKLVVYDLPDVRNWDEVREELKNYLKNCDLSLNQI